MQPLSLPVAVPGAQYVITLGQNVLAQAGILLEGLLPSKRIVVITDSHVAPLYLPLLEKSLQQTGFVVQVLTVPAGEGSKGWKQVQFLTDALLAARIDRRTTLLALGGGVIGDLAGFVAAITLRGIPFVQIPTTLLSQVDSSVGGKTGINTPQGKNLVGAFYQPLAVLMDTATLHSLPLRHRKAGYAEILKYGLLGDRTFFDWLDDNGQDVLNLHEEALQQAIATSCRAKAAIVAEDERESGIRALLNLGHTFGHALEAETGFSEALHHGEAVAMGCLMAFALSVRLGFCPENDYQRLRRHQAALGFPLSLPEMLDYDWNPQALLAHMEGDKKNQDGTKTFILLRTIGQAFIHRGVADREVLDLLTDFCQ